MSDNGSLAEPAAFAAPQKPRLVISTLELENFKSYYGVVTIGEFNKSMTCVIGPNGSGKSNVIDAALFAFGFNAKDMRQENALGLIHHSSVHQNVSFARVSINFQMVIDQPDGECEVVPRSQLTVTRRIERQQRTDKQGKEVESAKLSYSVAQYNAKGEWKEKGAERKEVRAMLLGKKSLDAEPGAGFWSGTEYELEDGIDLDHNRFCILQGEVEKIALMKPKGETASGAPAGSLGLRWKEVGESCPAGATEIESEALAKALAKKLEFGKVEFANMKVEGLKQTSVVRSGDKFFMPALATSKGDPGLLEYLENIITTDRLIEPIEAAKAAMEEANDRRAIENTALKSADAQLKAQEERKVEAEAFMAKEAELQERRSEQVQLELVRVGEELAVRRDELGVKQAELEEEKEKNRGKKAELHAIEKRYKTAKKAYDQCNEQLQKAKEEDASYQRMETEFEVEQKQTSKQISQAKDKVAKEKKRRGELEGELESAKAAAERLPDELEREQRTLEKERAELERQYDALAGEMGPLRQEKEEAQHRKEAQKEALAGPLDALEQLKDEAQRLASKESDGAEERAAAAGELAAHVEAVEKARSMLTACEAEKSSVGVSLETARAAERAAAEALGPLAEEEQAARTKLNEASSSTTSSSARSRMLSALMQQRSKGGAFAGIHGRLGALGRVPAELDTAASTAGASLDDIVVETTECAMACVEFIRRQNLGIATFLILDKQIAALTAEMDAPFQCPKGSRRLFDLVEVEEPRFRAAFYKCYRNTLVVDATDQKLARQIAFNTPGRKFRVVNMVGQIINISGTMEGGGNPLRGRIGPSAADGLMTPAQLTALEQRAAELTEQLRLKRAEHDEANECARALTRKLASATSECDRLRVRIDSATTTKLKLEERVTRAAQAGELTADERKRVKELQKEMGKLEKEVSAQQANVDAADAALNDVDRRIGELGGVRLKAQKGKVDMLEGQLKGKEEALAKARAQADECAKGVGKLTKSVEKAQEAVERLESELAEKQRKMKEETRCEALAVKDAFEKCQERAHEALGELKELDAEHQRLSATIDKKREASLVREVESLADEHKKVARAHKEMTRRLGALRTRAVQAAQDAQAEAEAAGVELPTCEWVVVGGGAAAAADEAVGEDAAEGGGMRVPERLRDLTADELSALSEKEVANAILALETALDKWEGEKRVSAIAEYHKRERERDEKMASFNAVTAVRDEQRGIFERLRQQRLDEFMAGFQRIGRDLKRMYRMITLGGDAELELLDNLDPFSEGINFAVRPPRKPWTHISMLSGGEKTLASLSLVFALHEYKPTPLYVMDEIDAALDFRNVSIVANYIKERTKNAQFIIISLRNNMFETADRLVGIYKTNEMTKSVAIDPRAFVIPAH